MRTGLYVRVATADQSAEMQVRELRAYAEHQGWEIAEVYEDVMSGAKASRPALHRLMAGARARRFDCVLVWRLDRFGRSLVDCLNGIKTLEEKSVCFVAVTQGLDTDTKNPGIPLPASRIGCGGRVRAGADPRANTGGAAPGGCVSVFREAVSHSGRRLMRAFILARAPTLIRKRSQLDKGYSTSYVTAGEFRVCC